MARENAPTPVRRRRRTIIRVFLIIAIAYAGWCAFLYFVQDHLMFPRRFLRTPTPDAAIPPTVERLWIDNDDGGKTEAWFLPAVLSEGAKSPAVIFTHGNAELIDDCLGDANSWTARGYHVLLCEYRGYGRSDGSPGEDAITSDVAKFYDMLAAREDVDASRIYAHGRSLGGGVAAQLAAKRPVAGLILESSFSSAASFAAGYGAPSFMVRSPFRTDRVLRDSKIPVIILHSVDDEIVRFSHAQSLKAVRPDAVLIELTGGHNTAITSQPDYWKGIDQWLVEHAK